MKAQKKLRALESGICSIAGCKRKWICGTYPPRRIDLTLFICRYHQKRRDVDDSFLWKIWGLPKPEKVVRPKSEQKITKKKQGKPQWQKILDTWFAKGRYPIHKFMNVKRWSYWFSIGGKKPEGDSRTFVKEKKLKVKVKRKRSYDT